MEGQDEIKLQNFAKLILSSHENVAHVPSAKIHHEIEQEYNGQTYKCALEMSRVHYPPAQTKLVHCCLSDSIDGEKIIKTHDGFTRGKFMNTQSLNAYLIYIKFNCTPPNSVCQLVLFCILKHLVSLQEE